MPQQQGQIIHTARSFMWMIALLFGVLACTATAYAAQERYDYDAVRCEFIVKRQPASETTPGNVAAKRNFQAMQVPVTTHRHVAQALRHQASDARDAHCNNP